VSRSLQHPNETLRQTSHPLFRLSSSPSQFGGEIADSGERSGVWGLCPHRGPGTEPLVRGSGGEAPRS